MKLTIKETNYIKLLPTKQEIIQRINQLCRKYGKSDVGKSLYHNLCDIGYYTEDIKPIINRT